MQMLTRCILSIALSAIALNACNSPSTASGPPVSVSAAKTSPDRSANRPPEILNHILPYPCYSSQPCPTDYEVIYKGNLTGDIPLGEQLSTHENAFCNPSGTPSCAPNVTYNPTSNTTTVEWSGPVVYHNRRDQRPGVHFGLVTAQVPKPNINQYEESSEWTYGSNAPQPMPIVSINSKQPNASAKWQYAVVYLAGTTNPSGGAEYATWTEISYVPKADDSTGGQPKLTFTNYGASTIYVTSSGIVTGLAVPTDPECIKNPACPDDLKLLGNLDAVGFPPPGSASSPFVPLRKAPKILKPQS